MIHHSYQSIEGNSKWIINTMHIMSNLKKCHSITINSFKYCNHNDREHFREWNTANHYNMCCNYTNTQGAYQLLECKVNCVKLPNNSNTQFNLHNLFHIPVAMSSTHPFPSSHPYLIIIHPLHCPMNNSCCNRHWRFPLACFRKIKTQLLLPITIVICMW